MKPTAYKSVAKWPHPEVRLGNANNESIDTHGTREAAEAVCRRLQHQGFGGDGKIFPLETCVVITIEGLPGNHISDVCKEAVATAIREKCNVEFDFNGIIITATPGSVPAELETFYSEESARRHEAYIASPEYKARQVEAERKERERKAKVAELLASAPANMTLRDAEGWKKACDANTDAYGGAVMTYAERWARMMEARMAKGEKLADVADECSHLADEEGITGFMYGCAVSTLARVWQHGEELRTWHNLKTQIRDEGGKANQTGGVLNPACLSIK